MKISFPALVGRIIALAVLTSGLTVRAAAHDLPADRSLSHAVTSDCLATTTPGHPTWPQSPIAVSEQSPLAPQRMMEWASQWNRPAANGLDWLGIRNALSQRLSQLSAHNGSPDRAIAVSPPDHGQAPRPLAAHSQATGPLAAFKTKERLLLDGYLAYDLHRIESPLHNWGWETAPMFGKSATAPMLDSKPKAGSSQQPTPATTVDSAARDTTAARDTFAKCLQQAALWQCVGHAWLSNEESVAGLTEKLAAYVRSAQRRSLEQLGLAIALCLKEDTVGTHIANGSPQSPAPRLSTPTGPDYAGGPQFIVIETSVGGHIVLTLAQAAHWQFETQKSRPSLADWLAVAFRPVQERVLTTASTQLESIGYQLLELSQRLSQSKLASRTGMKVR